MYTQVYDKSGETLLAVHIETSRAGRGRVDFCLEEHPLQVAFLKDYNLTSKPHAHVAGKVLETSTILETWIVLKGRAIANIFDGNGEWITVLILNPGDLLIQVEGGHSLNTDDAAGDLCMIEVKNGPYNPQDKIDLYDKK